MIAAPKAVTRLTSGQSNQTLRLKSDDSDLVLKRWQNDGLFQVDRGLEVTVQKTLAESGAAPEVLDWNEAEGWLLQPYLEAPYRPPLKQRYWLRFSLKFTPLSQAFLTGD